MQIMEKENTGSYKIICSWWEELNHYQYTRNGQEIYIEGLGGLESECLAHKLNKDNESEKDIISQDFMKLNGTRGEFYKVEYDPDKPVDKDYIEPPSFQELSEITKEKLTIGRNIYVPTSLYLSHGVDDFYGGIATISSVKDGFIEIQEDLGTGYSMDYILENQCKWKKEYKNSKAKPCPDYSPEFNEWD